jgi:hypothetical protein
LLPNILQIIQIDRLDGGGRSWRKFFNDALCRNMLHTNSLLLFANQQSDDEALELAKESITDFCQISILQNDDFMSKIAIFMQEVIDLDCGVTPSRLLACFPDSYMVPEVIERFIYNGIDYIQTIKKIKSQKFFSIAKRAHELLKQVKTIVNPPSNRSEIVRRCLELSKNHNHSPVFTDQDKQTLRENIVEQCCDHFNGGKYTHINRVRQIKYLFPEIDQQRFLCLAKLEVFREVSPALLRIINDYNSLVELDANIDCLRYVENDSVNLYHQKRNDAIIRYRKNLEEEEEKRRYLRNVYCELINGTAPKVALEKKFSGAE